MYLAHKIINGKRQYFIRKSMFMDGCYVSRELMDLGPDPAEHLVYPGGRSFYIHERVEDTLTGMGEKAEYDLLEKLFWPFVRPDIRHSLRGFVFRPGFSQKSRRLSAREDDFIRNHLHPVDKRRYNFLRLGEPDQSRLGRTPDSFYRPLAFKCRDELEYLFLDMEKKLEPRELSLYVYSFLYLRRFFSQIVAGRAPQGLDQEEVDHLFIEEICRLNQDLLFWKGSSRPFGLHPWLIRYVIMYFDYPLSSDSFLQDHLRDFIAGTRRRSGPFPRKRPSFSPDEAGKIMGVAQGSISSMSKQELTRLFRRKVKEMHPDRGGDHEKFIKLMEIFRVLIKSKM